jgi:phosphonopyruvate decarboxylase
VTGKEFAALLEAEGFDFSTGVPCSLIESLIATLESHPRLPYVAAVREDIAVGLAAGASLAGRTPAVLMQNSGLGTSLNALISLSLMYRLPALLLVTWRGYRGQDAPEHIVMGEISPALLALCGIPHRVLSRSSASADLAWARAEADRLSQPVALLVPPGVFAKDDDRHPAGPAGRAEAPAPAASAAAALPTLRGEVSRYEGLRAAIAALGAEPVVHANGYICRESYAVRDRPQNFYMIGSMGLAPAIALGVALARPDRKAVIFDGDGNLLMSLGILAMIGGGARGAGGASSADARARNLVHVVFDNEVYGSTGNQRSPSRGARLDALARAAGYASTRAVTAADDIRHAVAAALREDGPAFILAKVTAEQQPVPRIPYPPETIRDRFRSALGGTQMPTISPDRRRPS